MTYCSLIEHRLCGQSRQWATYIAKASRWLSSPSRSSVERRASIGVTPGGTIWLRIARALPTPQRSHHSWPRFSLAAVMADSNPYHADERVGVRPGCMVGPRSLMMMSPWRREAYTGVTKSTWAGLQKFVVNAMNRNNISMLIAQVMGSARQVITGLRFHDAGSSILGRFAAIGGALQ